MRQFLASALPLLILSVTPQPAIGDESPILSEVALERLHKNSGVTLQWIGWGDRGTVLTRMDRGVTYLSGGQIDENGPGTLWMDGKVIEAGEDYFIFDGLIRIANAPDLGRECSQTKQWRFAITQNRKYYRLREFEWCDGLTDYIDIYF